MRHASGTGLAAAGTILLGSLGTCVSGVIGADTPRALAGTVVTVTTLTVSALIFIHTWVTDTRDERRGLAAAQGRAEEEERSYFALKAALEGEQMRLTRDMAAERARMAARLAAEQAAMQAAFEEQRLEVAKEAFRTGVQMERSGMLRPEDPAPSNLIQFPDQQQGGRASDRERTREHGVVGP